MAHQAQWPGVIHHAAEDTFDQDMRRAMAESLAIYNGQYQQTAWHNGSSPDADTDDDADLQHVLALSMQTFEAEQQKEQLPCQNTTQEPWQANKHSRSPAPADTRTKRPQPADAETALAKRQRSSSAQALPQDPGAAALVALQELAARAGADALLALHHAPDSQHCVPQQQQRQPPQQQQQEPVGVFQGALPATRQYRDNAAPTEAAPAAAEGNPAGFGLGRSGSVENLNFLAGGAAGGGLNDLGGIDDLGLYDWSGDTVSGSRIAGGSGAGGSGAGADAEDCGDYDHVVDQGTWHQPQQVLLQMLQQQQQQQHAVLAGRGSKVSDVGARRLYQQGEAVWWTNPLTCFCHPAMIFGADTSALPAQQGAERRYIVDVQQSAVRYIEASTSELLPQLHPGDLVWCKPAMALAQQFNDKDAQHQQRQQQLLAVQASGAGGRNPWVAAPWELGVVEISKVHNGVPVLQVKLSSGGSCWFPVMHVDKVTEVGESSSAAEARALHQVAAAGEPVPAPAGGNDDDAAHQQQQQGERDPQQQQQPHQGQQQQHVQQQQQQACHQQQQQQQQRQQACHHQQQQQQHAQYGAPAAAAADSPAAADNSRPAVQQLQHCWSAPGNQGSAGDGSTGSVRIDGIQKDSSATATAVVTAPVFAAGAAPRQQSGCVTALPLAAAAPAVSLAVHEEVGDTAELLHQAEGAGDSLELCVANTYAKKVPQ